MKVKTSQKDQSESHLRLATVSVMHNPGSMRALDVFYIAEHV